MGKIMKISIIVCAYNGADEILLCLAALSKQAYVHPNDYEILIIDDGSVDGTREVVKRFVVEQIDDTPLVRYILIEHKGLSIGRNTGLFLSNSPIVAYIDQDATADKCWVSQLIQAWEMNPDADAIGGRIETRNKNSRTAQFLHDVRYGPMSVCSIIGTNMSFRKERLLEVGAFGDTFVSRGDDTFVVNKMGKDRKEVYWEEAMVYHDWPESLRQWFRERVSNGEMVRYIDRVFERKEYSCGPFLYRRLVILFCIIVMLWLFPTAGWWILCGVPALFVLQIIRKPTLLILRKKYPIWVAFFLAGFWLLLKEIGNWKFCLGWYRGSKIPVPENIMVGTVSKQFVVEEFSNL